MNGSQPEDRTPPNFRLASASTPSDRPQETGEPHPRPSVPDHELLRRIGRGSYGQVWLARNVMGAFRAVKVVYRSDFEHDRPFEREFEGIQKFEPISRTHESQVDILHVGRNEKQGYFYYVMELADDQDSGQEIHPDNYAPKSLRSELHRRDRLPLEECLRIGLSLTTALEHLHKHGLVHRDVKPSNIIFVNGLTKLADIGLVASMDATMSFVGTAGYLPPEGPGTPQGDIYSLGKVLYELCTGRDRQNFPELPTEWKAFVDQEGLLEFNAVLMRACESDVRKRYQSAQEMHTDLALLQSGKSIKRLRLIERRLAFITRFGLGATAVAVVALGAYFGAVKQAHRAQRAENQLRQQLYASDINRANHLWEQGNLKRAIEVLEAHRPDAKAQTRNSKSEAERDLRGFEWFYLWRLCHPDNAIYSFRACTNGLLSANFSPDCTILATSGEHGPLVLWDLASYHQLATLPNFGGDIVNWTFSPDGKIVAYGTASGSIDLWDIAARKLAATLPITNQISDSMTFSPDGTLLAVVERDSSSVRLWKIASGRLLDTLRSEEGGYICGAAFSSDGGILAAGHRDNLVTLWDASSWKKLGALEVPVGFAGNLAFSPDNKMLAVAGVNSFVALCDVALRKTIGVLWGHEGMVNAVAWSRDGHTIATGSDDNTVKLWSPRSLQAIATLRGHLDRVVEVAFLPDGKTLGSVATDGTVKLWDLSRKTNQDVLLGHEDWARSVAFSPDGRTLASASKDTTVKLWDVATGQLLFTLLGHQRPVYRLAWSSDGRTLATVSGLVTEPNELSEVKLWDAVERKELVTLTNQSIFVCSVAITTNGRTLATGNANGSVSLWNIAGRQQTATLAGHSNQVQGLAFSPDGKLLATGGFDNWVKLWDVATKRELAALPGSAGNTDPWFAIWCLTFSPDGHTLAVGNDDGSVMLWNVSTHKLSGTLKGTAGRIYSIAFPPDGRTLVTANQNALSLWHLATGQEMIALQGHQSSVESVAFSADGLILASASADKTVRLWRAATRGDTEGSR